VITPVPDAPSLPPLRLLARRWALARQEASTDPSKAQEERELRRQVIEVGNRVRAEALKREGLPEVIDLPRRRGEVRAAVSPTTLPHLLSVDQAASILATTPGAVRARVERGQLTGLDGLVRSGRKIQFLRDRLLQSLEKNADANAPKKGRGR